MKLGSVVDSMRWHGSTNQLAAVMEGQVALWIYPYGAFVECSAVEKFRVMLPLELSCVPLAAGGAASTDLGLATLASLGRAGVSATAVAAAAASAPR
jgi:hypothetical protein